MQFATPKHFVAAGVQNILSRVMSGRSVFLRTLKIIVILTGAYGGWVLASSLTNHRLPTRRLAPATQSADHELLRDVQP